MALIELTPVRVVAAKEFRERIRNRWVLASAVVFAAFALSIAYFGAAQQGAVGFRSIEITIASLTSLAIYLVPLISLILGFDAIVGERERGSLDLLLSMPMTRFELLLGKYLGLSMALALSTLGGFGAAGIFLLKDTSEAAPWINYFQFVGSSILMGMAFLAIAVLLSVMARDRARASGGAVAVWFFFVLVFDLALLGILVASGGQMGGEVFSLLLFANPADVFRIINVFGMEEVRSFYGLASVFPPALARPWLLFGAMGAWIAAPLLLATWRFKA